MTPSDNPTHKDKSVTEGVTEMDILRARTLWWDEIVPHMNVDTPHPHECKLADESVHIAEALAAERRAAIKEALWMAQNEAERLMEKDK